MNLTAVSMWQKWYGILRRFCDKKSWFGEGQMIQFEDIKVKAPKDIDSFLKVYYGDYMKLPPVEQRVPSHGYALYKRE